MIPQKMINSKAKTNKMHSIIKTSQHHDVLTEGSNGTEKSFRLCVDVLMNPDIATGIKDTDKHIFGMQVDSTIKLVLLGVEIHMASSF